VQGKGKTPWGGGNLKLWVGCRNPKGKPGGKKKIGVGGKPKNGCFTIKRSKGKSGGARIRWGVDNEKPKKFTAKNSCSGSRKG